MTPNDIRSYEFSGQMRGYDKEEVDNFLEKIAQDFELAKQENTKIKSEMEALRLQVSALQQNEDIIKSAAIDARRNADLTISNAKKEALALLAKAKEEIGNISGLKKKKILEVEEQIKKIEQSRKTYLTKLRTLVSSHLDMVEKESLTEVRDVMSELGDINVTKSNDITPNKMETIGVPPAGKHDADKSDIPMEIRTTVHGDSGDEPNRVEEGDIALADALRKYHHDKDTASAKAPEPEFVRPEPVPSLASPKKKWGETHARAEEVPTGFIAKSQAELAALARRKQAATPSMEPNPVLTEEVEANESVKISTKPGVVGKVDVAREFDEIAARFNEEMDKAEKKR